MQTFVPYTCFHQSARCLDYRRLGKQRVETLQILQALDTSYNPTRSRRGWVNHPATKMWRGHEGALAAYGMVIVQTWIDRGYRDIKCGPQIRRYYELHRDDRSLPRWWGDMRVHNSHRSNLVRKLPEHYVDWFGDIDPTVPYHWPVQ